jgi:hypothetical protein
MIVRRILPYASALAGLLVAVNAVSSCSSVPSDARIGIDAPSGAEPEFRPVGEYLNDRCGSLDCHGQTSRNLQIWGCNGMRIDPKMIPSCLPVPGGGQTTVQELNATYRSLVGLEPTVMSEVYDNHGAHPELLTFVRKARGLEAHKGGTLITPGDDQDICITSWLAGNTNKMECGVAQGLPMFPPPPSAAGDAAVE